MKAIFWVCILVVGAVYFLYPLCVCVLARTVSRPRSPQPAPQSASVVLVVRNEVSRIGARIENLRAQSPQGVVDEIVVVSDGSDDGTDDLVRRLALADPRLRLISVSGRLGKAAGLNAGIEAARNDYIVFADARQRFRPDAVSRLLARFEDMAVGAVAGELRFRSLDSSGQVAASIGLYWRYETWIRKCEARFDSVMGCPGAIYAVNKNLVTPVPIGLILDDVWIPMHVILRGKRVAYEETAIAEDDPSNDLSREFGRKVRTLAGNFQITRAAPRIVSPWHCRVWWMFLMHKLMRLVVPYALAGALVSSLLVREPFYIAMSWLQSVFYAIGLIGYLGAGKRGACRACASVEVFLSLNAAAVVAFAVAIAGQSHTLWGGDAATGQRKIRT